MKYNVGDKVKIREDLKVGRRYNKCLFVENMKKYKGKIATITEITDNDYDIDIDDGDWCWTDEMFEDIKFNVGDIEKEANSDFTVENILSHTDVEKGGFIITIFYPNANFEATIGHNRINRNSELYKRFIKAYGDMIVDEISFAIKNDKVVMRIKVDYAD